MPTYSLSGNTYTDKTNSVDVIDASHINNLQDEVEIIEAILFGTTVKNLDLNGTFNANTLTSDGTITAGTGLTVTTGNLAVSAGTITASGAITGGSFVGTNALYRPTTGSMASDSISTMTGTQNTIFGIQTGLRITTGGDNTIIGYQAGVDLTEGNDNTLLGRQAGYELVDGENNVFLGLASGYDNVSGIDNVMVGRLSGFSNIGSGNVFLGNRTGQNETGSNKLYIDNSNTATPLIYGDFATDALTINGTLTATGAITGASFIGTNALYRPTTGSITSDARASMTGISNTAYGVYALNSITSGTQNTALGNYALYNLTTGIRNSAFGYQSLQGLVDGEANSALGRLALYSVTSGDSNTGVGRGAGYSITTQNNNTFLGDLSGFTNTGSGNTFIGYRAGHNETGSNKLYIDNSDTATPLIYGDFATDELTVNGDLDATGNIETAGSFVGTNALYRPFTACMASDSRSWSQSSNNAYGQLAQSADPGKYNNAFGYSALRYNTGTGNSAFGTNALGANIDGNYNTAFGDFSLRTNESGDNNFGGGRYSLNNLVNGDNNTAVGKNAGYSALGSGNVFVGYAAGENETGSNKLYIANNQTATPLIYGDFSTSELTINGDLEVTGSITGGEVSSPQIMTIRAVDDNTALTTGDGKIYFTIPDKYNGWTITDIDAAVYTASSSGLPSIQVHNVTDTVDILSTNITIDEGEYNSYTALTPPVIANAALATGDILRIDVDAAGTDTEGLDVILVVER